MLSSINDLAKNKNYEKNTFLIILVSLFISSCSTDESQIPDNQAPIFIGDVLLKNQTEVETFGSMGYGEITGTLEISGEFETTDPIASLDSLSTITIVGGDLRLISLFDLPSFNGLDNLESLSGALYLYGNSLISSLEAFTNVTSTVQSLEVNMCRGLSSLIGLDNLSIASGGSLIIEGNDQLEDLSSIQNGLPATLDTIRFGGLDFECPDGCGSFTALPQPFGSLNFLSNVNEAEYLVIKDFIGTTLSGT